MAFKHYLNFLSLPSVGTIEIAEPIGFDGASYKIKQDDKRFGRDIIIANEDTELTFTRDYFEQIQLTQILPSGEIFNYASQGFDYILDIFQNDGWEGKIEYIIEKDGNQFTTGVFSYYTSLVEFDNIKVKIIQNTNREILKRLDDTDIDAFNNKSLDDVDITPCLTTNILLKAKPITQISKWVMNTQVIIDNFQIYRANPSMNLESFAVQNSLVPFEQRVADSNEAIRNFRYVKAYTDLSEGVGSIRCNAILQYRPNGNSDTDASFRLLMIEYQGEYNPGDPIVITEIYRKAFSGGSNIDFNLDTTFNFNLPNLTIGKSLSFYWIFSGASTGVIGNNKIVFNEYNMELQYVSTYINTVIKGVRLIDLIKHNVKSIIDIPVNAPDYDLGGEHYNNFAFNGLLLGQITDKPFYNQFKDLMNIPLETCSDYQINPSNLEILPYSDFYIDEELAVFDELPSFNTLSKFSKQYSLKNAEFKYNKSSNENTTNAKDSIDDVHTETQKYITNTVDGSLKIDIKHIRSSYLIEQARQRAFDSQETTSLQNDDNLFLLDCIALQPGTRNGFGAILGMQVAESGSGVIKLLNNNLQGDGLPFDWSLLGIAFGSEFVIESGENAGTYLVSSVITPGNPLSVLELSPTSFPYPTFNGESYIVVSWELVGVNYTNRTNEGFSLIEGIDNPSKYSNLNYHWARNIQRWYPYLATSTKFKPNDVIKTSSFKVNGNLVTRKIGETVNVSDSADILNSDIASKKILNPFVHTVKVYADFNTVTQLIEDIRDIKGYVTVNLNDGRMIKGFIQSMDYTWISEELDLTIEEKFISDFMNIDIELLESGKTITTIEQPSYDIKNNLKSFQINNIFVTLYDSYENELFPPTRYTNVKINGIQYTDIIEFSDRLTELINMQNE
jgi:hypothetical protein